MIVLAVINNPIEECDNRNIRSLIWNHLVGWFYENAEGNHQIIDNNEKIECWCEKPKGNFTALIIPEDNGFTISMTYYYEYRDSDSSE